MRKIKQIFTPILLLLTDLAFVIASFYVSFFLRYGTDIPAVNFEPFKRSFLALGFIYIVAFTFAGIFQKRFRSHWELCRKVFIGMVVGTLFSFVFLYVFRIKWSTFPSSVFVIVIPTGTVLIATVNVIIRRLTKSLKTILVVVGKTDGQEILITRSRLEINRVKNIEDVLQFDDIDEILICEYIHKDSQLNLLIHLLNKLKVNVSFSPDLYAELLSSNIEQGNTLRFLAASIGRKSDLDEFMMAAIDTTGSVCLIILTFPIIIIVSILIKLSSKGPILYKQERIGKDGKSFILYKFRTMFIDAECETGPVLAAINDPRVTSIGRILRTTRIDELPQLFNVLSGQMSLVGPRPERSHFIKLHKGLQGIRLAVKPGLTGLAQIRNFYDLRPKHKIKYDLLYIQRRSLLLNVYILLKTIPVVFSKKGW